MSNYILLTDKEMLLLDGKCSDKVQKEINAAKNRLSFECRVDAPAEVAALVADIVGKALNVGRLQYRVRRLRLCRVCGKSAGYAKYARRSKWHQKGDLNYDKPLSFSGIDCEPTSVIIGGRTNFGCCQKCWEYVKPILVVELANIKADIPENISGVPSKWKYHPKRKCLECKWEGHEGQLGKLPALMAGEYPGQCPKCGTKSLPLGPTVFENITGFELVKSP